MATYADLAGDVRLRVPELTADEYSDADLTRFLFGAALQLLNKAAQVAGNQDSPILPVGQNTQSLSGDISQGFALSSLSDANRVLGMRVYNSDGDEAEVNMVPWEVRYADVSPIPAGTFQNRNGSLTFFPIPGDGSHIMTLENIEAGGWEEWDTLEYSYLDVPDDPTDETDTFPLHRSWWFAVTLGAAAEVAGILESRREAALLRKYDDAEEVLMDTLSHAIATGQQIPVQRVY